MLTVLSIAAASCRFAVGITFLAACQAKLRDLPGFARGVAAYRLLPGRLVIPAAAVVILAEAAAAALLITGWNLLAGAVTAMAGCGLFAVAVAVNLARQARIPCHCFGGGEQISARTLARIGFLSVGAATVTAARAAGLGLTTPVLSAATVMRLTAGAGFVLAALWALAIPDIVRLLRAERSAG